RPEDAEDLVQEVFLDLWRNADRYDPEQSSEPAFVAMVTRRRLIDRLRREQRRPQTLAIEARDFSNDDHAHVENAVEAALAAKALAALKPKERDVLLLAAYHGLSHGQIAEKTGIPLGTVKTYVRRGLMRVKEMLEGKGSPRMREVGA